MPRPLYDALCDLSDSNPLRMHMPGHKGIGADRFEGISSIDFTEITPTGNLYTDEGPFSAAENLCASFAGAKDAMFFSCGSTQGIYTMLAEAVGMDGEMILERGCHKSVYQAMALLNITPHYLFAPMIENGCLSGPVLPSLVEDAIKRWPNAKALFLTTPTYYGVITDLAPIAAVCHQLGCALLVDQAHGAHFPAVDLPSAAMQGADLTVVSTHKTWPALGSSSVLYLGTNRFQKEHLKKTSALFGTTSPSYPILASIDYARDALEQQDGDTYRYCAVLTQAFREKINLQTPFRALCDHADFQLDPCRLTIDVGCAGLTGYEADRLLQTQNIYIEMADERYIVLILTCRDDESSLQRLWDGLIHLIPHCGTRPSDFSFSPPPLPITRCGIRTALLGPTQEMPLIQAVGRISGSIVAPYPPGIPVLAPGEEITEKHIAYLQKKSYNIKERIAVVSAAESK